MKKLELSLIVTCLILAFFLLSAFVLTSCKSQYVTPEFDKGEPETLTSMFVIVERSVYYDIVYDKETKVMYAFSHSTYNGGNYFVLVNADGTPKLWED